ncbi:MAG: site-specific integrase [Puniceicoccaceae bacterium]
MPRTARPVPEFKLSKIGDKKNFYLCWSENRRSRRISTGTDDPGRAQQFLADFINGWNAPPPKEEITCDDVIKRYLDHKDDTYESDYRSRQAFQSLVVSLDPISDYFGSYSPESISRQQSREYIEFQRKNEKANATIRRQLAIFTAALNFAHAEGWIGKVPILEKPKEPPPKDKWMTPEQVRTFLDQCRTPHIRLFTQLALHTLSRKAAILDLKWSQVDLDRRLINFNPPGRTQTKKRRVPVGINDNLYSALKEAAEFGQTEYVIEFNGKRVIDNKKAFARVAKRAGMPWVTPHVLRHTGATLLAQRGVPLWEIAGIMGDRLTTVEKHYAKHHPDYLKKAIDTLDDLYG